MHNVAIHLQFYNFRASLHHRADASSICWVKLDQRMDSLSPPPIWRSDKMQNFASLDAQNASPYPTKSNTSSHKMKTNDFKCSSVWNSDCVADAFSAMRFFLQVQFVESQNVESNVRDQGWRGWLGVVSLQRPWKWQKFDLYIFRSFLQIFIYQQPADMNGKLH
jgi:hypothetical protein